MMMTRSIKISHKLAIMTISGLLVLICIGLTGVYIGKTGIKAIKDIYAGKMLPLDQLRTLQTIFREIDYQMVGVISAAESSQTALVHLDKSVRKIKSLWKNISPTLINEGTLEENIKTVNIQLNKFWELVPRLENAYKADNIDDVDMIHEEWKQHKKKIFSSIDKLAEMQKEVTSRFFNTQNNLVNKISTVLLLVLFGSILGFIAFTFFITRSIKRPVSLVVESAQRIADGDLTVRIPVTGSDEMGIMGDALNRMIERLNTLFGTISSNVTLLNRQSETLSSATSEMFEGATLQNNQIEQVASATEEMSQTIIEMAENASSSSEAARNSHSLAEKGSGAVKEVIQDIRSLAEQLQTSSSEIENLGRRSSEIGEIVNVIQDIADQTNLLALNAAIEAARAGEQGRGFAVVADEVKKLAEKTGRATEEISEKIRSIQSETDSIISLISKGNDSAKTSVEKAIRAGEALAEIVQTSRSAMEMIQRIAAATEEQSSAAEQVSHSMEVVSEIVKGNSVKLSTLQNLSQELFSIAKKLEEEMERFRTEARTTSEGVSSIHDFRHHEPALTVERE